MESNIRSATSIITELRDGQLVTEMSAALHDAIAAVKQHDKAAEVVLKVKIAPFTNQRLVDPAVIITGEVECKLPKQVPDATIFFVDANGNPTRQPDRQRDLALSVLPLQTVQQGA